MKSKAAPQVALHAAALQLIVDRGHTMVGTARGAQWKA